MMAMKTKSSTPVHVYMAKLGLFGLLCIVTLLVGCATGSPYKAASGTGYGYQETRISEDRYRVSFTVRRTQHEQARDYAMLRAAELTLLEGYDWFVVVDRETATKDSGVAPAVAVSTHHSDTVVRDCGLLGCTTHRYPRREMGAEFDTYDRSQSKAVSILEIRLGKGVRPEAESYDAREVRASLRSSLSLKEHR